MAYALFASEFELLCELELLVYFIIVSYSIFYFLALYQSILNRQSRQIFI